MSQAEQGEQPPVVNLGRLGTLHPVDEEGAPQPIKKEEKKATGKGEEPPVVHLNARVYRGPGR
jgi:hypothetical protein